MDVLKESSTHPNSYYLGDLIGEHYNIKKIITTLKI